MTARSAPFTNSLGRRGLHLGTGALLVGAVPALALLTTSTADAATITVANTNDSGAGSLRAALAAASAGDTIDLTGLAGTINLNNLLPISSNVTIIGPGAPDLTLTSYGSAIFEFGGANGLTTISGLTLTEATHSAISCVGHTGADLKLQNVVITGNSADRGGGVLSSYCGSLEIVDSTFTENTALYNGGGGVYFKGTESVTITGSTFDSNGADAYYSSPPYAIGGGAYIRTSASISITDSSFTNNTAYYLGAGAVIRSDDVFITRSTFSANSLDTYGGRGAGAYINGSNSTGTAIISQSTFENNSGYIGGGITARNLNTVTISATTISGNETIYKGAALYMNNEHNEVYNTTIADNTVGANGGGAVYVTGDLTMKFVTVNGNTTETGVAGLYFHSGTDVIDSSIIVGNGTTAAAAMKTYRSTVMITQSLLSDYADPNITTDGTDLTGVSDAGLGSLADNGGPTKTKALLASSPAIDLVTSLPAPFPGSPFDQRSSGYDRVTGTHADAGAFEYGSTPPTTTTSTTTPVSSTSSTTTADEVVVPAFTG